MLSPHYLSIFFTVLWRYYWLLLLLFHLFSVFYDAYIIFLIFVVVTDSVVYFRLLELRVYRNSLYTPLG